MGETNLVPDIPRYYTAIAEWAACFVMVLVLRKRFKGIKEWLICAGFFVLIFAVQYVAGILPIYLWIPGMITAMLAMYLCLYTLANIKLSDAVFWTARAFVFAEFCASLFWQLNYFFVKNFPGFNKLWIEIFFASILYAAVFATAYFIERRYQESNQRLKVHIKDFVSAVSVALLVFLISNMSFISSETPISGQTASEIYYIRTLVDLCGIILLYALQEQRHFFHAKTELDAIQGILSRQYENYVISKENIELLNRRYHDLKHQIDIVRLEENPVKRNEYLDNMQTGIRLHEAFIQTENSVLDTILTSKNLKCVEHDITFTCVADGSQLHYLNVMDICTIFGNALDNAIESVITLKEKEKRIIKMAVSSKEDFLIIRFENYIESAPDFEDGLPVSTKKSKTFADVHGYGIKSIKAAAAKYGGSIKISVNNNMFTLFILIPKI